MIALREFRGASPALFLVSLGVGIFLFLPIFVVFLYSFNSGDYLIIWRGFSARWYGNALANTDITTALKTSFVVASASGMASIVLGGLCGFILARRSRFVAAPLALLLVVVLAFPEIVKGVAYLMWFVRIGLDFGIPRMIIAHCLFGSAIVAFLVRARLAALDQKIEEAAADLGANPLVIVWTVTCPLMLPALLAGGLLAFTLSLDDVVVSMFVSTAQTTPLPVYILASVRQGLKGDVAAMSTMVFAMTALAFTVVAIVLARLGASRQSAVMLLAGRDEGAA